MQESVTPDAAQRSAVVWSLTTQVLFRFTFTYFALFALPSIEGFVPGTTWLSRGSSQVWYRITPWVGRNLLGIPQTISVSELSSGDRATDYIEFFCIVVLACAVTAVWSILDRRARAYPRLDALLRVYVRFALGSTMLMYGVIKLMKGQFFAPSLEALIEPLGQLPPMGLLWTFMGYSKPYTFFAGLAETLAGVLLFFRRTALLGALLAVGVLTNVAMLNFSYHVTVKLNSLNFLFWALFLCAPDARRLFDFFVRNRPTEPPPARRVFSSPRMMAVARTAQAVAIGFAVYKSTASALPIVREYGDDVPKHPLFGIYDVSAFLVNGEPQPALATDGRRWRRIIIGDKGRMLVRRMNDTVLVLELDPPTRSFVLAERDGRKSALVYAEPAPAELELTGRLGDDDIVVKSKRFDEKTFPLLAERFRWINPQSLE